MEVTALLVSLFFFIYFFFFLAEILNLSDAIVAKCFGEEPGRVPCESFHWLNVSRSVDDRLTASNLLIVIAQYV